jgi:hypothetical protein
MSAKTKLPTLKNDEPGADVRPLLQAREERANLRSGLDRENHASRSAVKVRPRITRRYAEGIYRYGKGCFRSIHTLCGFRAVCVLRAYYPTGIARGFGPFVDLLLTRGLDSKKPRWLAGRKALMLLEDFGCGDRI